MNYIGKNIVCSGGLGAIGIEVCGQLIKQGAKCLAILDIMEMDHFRLVALKKNLGHQCNILYIKLDITKKDDVENGFKMIIGNFKSIDILINIAGMLNDKKLYETMNVNFFGVVNVTLTAMDYMCMNEKGDDTAGIIVTIASTIGLEPYFVLPIYSASKHAVMAFMRCISNNYYSKKYGIKFLTICPGLTDTTLAKDLEHKALFPNFKDLISNEMDLLHVNTSMEMAKYVTDVITIAKNGSFWICDNGLKEITFATYWP